ncbi:MAG: hypothetical protein CVV49_07780 [Spirochaetae bacterium HGW-Spirochaetae-5]|nr:MAG: hypothetical protein CVV49_07780 [Spirochaetae bacterium HGW-Spirochaetae-5]
MINKLIKFFIITLPLLLISNTPASIENNKYYYIKSVVSGDADRGYWDLPGGGRRYKNGDDLHLWAFDKGDDRKYMITPAENGWNYISPASAASGTLFYGTVSIAGNTIEEGSKLDVRDIQLTDNTNQLFKVKHIGEGRFMIFVNSNGGGKVICTEGGADKNGTSVIVMNENSTPSCQWRFIEVSGAVKN